MPDEPYLASSGIDVSWENILQLSLFAILNEVARPLGLLFNTAFLGHVATDSAYNTHVVAAYAAVLSTFTFAEGLFNFVISVVMATVGRAVGSKRWDEVGQRVAVALLTAFGSGVLCSALLWPLQDPIFSLMSLIPEVRSRAEPYYNLRLLCTPLSLVGKCGLGVLSGFGRLREATAVSVAAAAIEAFGTYLSVFILVEGLQGSGVATLISTCFTAVMSVLLAGTLWPANAPGPVRLRLKSADSCGDGPDAALLLQEEAPTPFSVCGFLRDSSNVMIRSALLQGSMYSLYVACGRAGTHVLAGHQITCQLWMATSYFCDGYADVGTMLGSRLLASTTEEAGRSMSRMTRRLLLLGVSTGLVAAAVFLGLQESIIHVFAGSADAEVRHSLRGVWTILTALQPFNALVFVYDGLLYATHSFVFVRNIFIIGVLGIFFPVLITADIYFHTLAAIWSAKVGLNLWRVGSSFFHINLQLEPTWLNRSPIECE